MYNNKATYAPASGPAIYLAGTQSVLRDVAGTPALDSPQATLQFSEAGRVAGDGSCNRFTGSIEVSGTSLKFDPLASCAWLA
jgi:heat shock protein HslJ